MDLNNISSELKSAHDLDEGKQISIELLEDIHQPIKIILEKNAGNIVGSKKLEITSSSNETVLMGDAPAAVDMEKAIPFAPDKDK